MTAYSEVDAKAELSRLIDRALCGDEVVIKRHGRPVAEIRALTSTQVGPTAYEWLRARRLARKGVGLTSVELLDQLYEGSYIIGPKFCPASVPHGLRRAAPSPLQGTPPSLRDRGDETRRTSSSLSEAWGGGPRNAVEGPRESAETTPTTPADLIPADLIMES